MREIRLYKNDNIFERKENQLVTRIKTQWVI